MITVDRKGERPFYTEIPEAETIHVQPSLERGHNRWELVRNTLTMAACSTMVGGIVLYDNWQLSAATVASLAAITYGAVQAVRGLRLSLEAQRISSLTKY